ncbi:MAG TPA: hypothetical protein VIS03_08915 [Kiloniellaceae bacterium]
MTFQGNERRLAPQRLILDPMDALVLRRGFLRQPRPLGQLKTKIVESLAVGEAPGEGTPVDPPKELVLIRSPGGYLIFFDKVKDEILGFRTSRLAAGRYTVEVSGRAYQPLRAAVVLADVPPPFEDLPDNAGAQTAVVVALEPSFLHPTLDRAGGTQVGGALQAPEPGDFDRITVTIMANGTDLATYAVDRRGQWLLPLPNASPPFGPGPPPRTAPVTVLVRRGTDQLVSQTVTVTENELTTVATIVLPGA